MTTKKLQQLSHVYGKLSEYTFLLSVKVGDLEDLEGHQHPFIISPADDDKIRRKQEDINILEKKLASWETKLQLINSINIT